MITVVTMLWGNWGKPFQSEYVNRLFCGVRRHLPLPHKFVCVSDEPLALLKDIDRLRPGLPGWTRNLNKFWLYKPNNGLKGRILFFDLDTVIVGDLSEIAQYDGYWCGIQPFDPERAKLDTHSGGGVMSFEAGTLDFMWDEVSSDPEGWAEATKRPNTPQFPGGIERFALKRLLGDRREHWQTLYPGQVVSYKRHIRQTQKVPKNARVVCFHGKPRPHEVNEPWMKEHWI